MATSPTRAYGCGKAGGMGAEVILQHLDKVRPTGPGKWLARCPAHPDKTPSLSIRETDGGNILVFCFAGCPADEVVSAAGLQLADLFPEPLPTGTHSHKSTAPRICWPELFSAIEDELLTIAIAWADFSKGVPLSSDDALYLSRKADCLASIISEARNAR